MFSRQNLPVWNVKHIGKVQYGEMSDRSAANRTDQKPSSAI